MASTNRGGDNRKKGFRGVGSDLVRPLAARKLKPEWCRTPAGGGERMEEEDLFSMVVHRRKSLSPILGRRRRGRSRKGVAVAGDQPGPERRRWRPGVRHGRGQPDPMMEKEDLHRTALFRSIRDPWLFRSVGVPRVTVSRYMTEWEICLALTNGHQGAVEICEETPGIFPLQSPHHSMGGN